MIATLITLAMLYAPAKDEMDPYWFLPPHERPKNEEVVEQESVEESVSVVQTASSGDSMTYAGCYELTAYIATGNPCSSGVYPTVGRTVACNSIPLGTTVYIEGYGTYVVEDTGGMGGGVIDVFVSSYDEAIQFGRKTAEVYIVD